MEVLKKLFKIFAFAKERLWDFFDAFNEDKIYALDTTDMLQKYVDFKIHDIAEFAAAYTYDFHDTKHILDNKKSKANMYSEVYKMMRSLEKRGSLND